MGKINGNLLDEFKSLEDYKKNLIKTLKIQRLRSKILWTTLTVLVAIANIITIVLTLVALLRVLREGGADTSIAPIIAITVLVILSFIINFVISIYQGIMRAKVYKEAVESIQFETMQWTAKIGQYSAKNSDDIFKENIEFIEKQTKSIKNKASVKQALLNILTGGHYE